MIEINAKKPKLLYDTKKLIKYNAYKTMYICSDKSSSPLSIICKRLIQLKFYKTICYYDHLDDIKKYGYGVHYKRLESGLIGVSYDEPQIPLKCYKRKVEYYGN